MKALLAFAGTLAPSLAAACPSCARDQTPYAPLIIAGMIAAPYLVAAVVIYVVRSSGGEP